MKTEIKHRWTGAVLYSGEHATVKDALLAAIAVKADLRRADLSEAYLSEADLSGADLSEAMLSEAYLSEADLRRADLSGADLSVIKADLFLVLALGGVEETRGLLESLRSGEIDGSQYEGECCCLVGTLANQKGCAYNAIEGLIPNAYRPAERWFLAIRTGDTPETSQVAKITEGWIEEWLSANKVTA